MLLLLWVPLRTWCCYSFLEATYCVIASCVAHDDGFSDVQVLMFDAAVNVMIQDTMFLPLDDVLEEGKHIDLALHVEDQPQGQGDGVDGANFCELQRRRHGRRSSMLSLGGTVGFSEDNLNRSGVLEKSARVGGGADISRPPMFLMEQDYGNSFKMSTCSVDEVRRKALGVD